MKGINKRKIRRDKDAVSPVIATILMVAVTVVIAATVYSYTSGSGGSKRTTPAINLSMKKTGVNNITLYHDGGDELQWADVKVLNDGSETAHGKTGDFTVGQSAQIITNTTSGSHRVKVIWEPTNSILIDKSIRI